MLLLEKIYKNDIILKGFYLCEIFDILLVCRTGNSVRRH